MSAAVAQTNGVQQASPAKVDGPAAVPTSTALVKAAVTFKSVDEVLTLARVLYTSGVQPNGVDRPEKLVPIILAGLEVGLGVMQSCKHVMMVNGQPSIWGDAGLALVRQSGKLVYLKEWIEGEGDARTAVCEIQRTGADRKLFKFTMGQAAKLASVRKAKEGTPWANDPDNMLHWRALWRALRSEFPDVLMGLSAAEESEDIITAEVMVKPAPGEAAIPQPATAPAPVVEHPVTPAVTEDQLKELRFLRTSFMSAKSLSDQAEQASAWIALLAPYDVQSARQLTPQQADHLIDSLGKVHGFPPFSPRVKAAA